MTLCAWLPLPELVTVFVACCYLHAVLSSLDSELSKLPLQRPQVSVQRTACVGSAKKIGCRTCKGPTATTTRVWPSCTRHLQTRALHQHTQHSQTLKCTSSAGLHGLVDEHPHVHSCTHQTWPGSRKVHCRQQRCCLPEASWGTLAVDRSNRPTRQALPNQHCPQ